jgi:hypothetical protein
LDPNLLLLLTVSPILARLAGFLVCFLVVAVLVKMVQQLLLALLTVVVVVAADKIEQTACRLQVLAAAAAVLRLLQSFLFCRFCC